MLKIRLKRSGRKKRPYFHVVVAEHSRAASKKYIQRLGGYNPLEEDGFKVDDQKLLDWIKKGAKPTDTVARLMKGKGFDGMDGFIEPMKDRSIKNPKDQPEEKTPDTSGESSASPEPASDQAETSSESPEEADQTSADQKETDQKEDEKKSSEDSK